MRKEIVFPFENDARKYASVAYTMLFIQTNNGSHQENIRVKGEELFSRGMVSGVERALAAIEKNPKWDIEAIKKETSKYASEVKKKLPKIKSESLKIDHKVATYFIEKFIYGEIEGCKSYLEILKTKAEDRNDALAEAHFFIRDNHNSYVEKFNTGRKINIEFFTDRYINNPEIFA